MPETPNQPRGPSAHDVDAWQVELREASPHAVVQHAVERFGAGLKVAFSGAEDVLVVDLVAEAARAAGVRPTVFCLDTGRLHPETLRFIEQVREAYPQLGFEVVSPDAAQVEALVRDKGLFSFLRDGHKECCGVRKVAPLRRTLRDADAWMTGQRRDQSPETRAEVPHVQVDEGFSTAEHTLIKYNPLAAWSSAQVWRFLRGAGIPFNPLHERGYVSIGCAPCTRPVLPGQHEREGRWWWELADDKECGLHVGEPTRS
jgi:phosphoadenosine phosphosulfate reductase